jgi:hypothetical protein
VEQAGASYLIEPEPPHNCDSTGCVVMDAVTGARLEVLSGALTSVAQIGVSGLLSVGQLPTPEPAGTMLVGAIDLDPEGKVFGMPNPTVTLPVRPTVESQVSNGEVLDLYYFNGASWVDSGSNGTVSAALQGGKKITGTISVLHVYAAFVPDADGDGMRDTLDCRPADPTVLAGPAEVAGLAFGGKTAMVWTSQAGTAGTATVYDVVRGSLSQFPVGTGGSETCVAPGSTTASATDVTTPVAGAGYYYLVRGRNVCGTGTYGYRSGGAERVSSACP